MNVLEHLTKTNDELEKLNTRHLDAMRKDCYRHIVDNSQSEFSGDEYLTEEEIAQNQQVTAFQKRVIAILNTRENIPATGKAARQAAAKYGR